MTPDSIIQLSAPGRWLGWGLTLALCLSIQVTGGTVQATSFTASEASQEWQQPPGTLLVHALDPRRIYSLSRGGEFSRSEDGGDTWWPVSPMAGEGAWATLAVWQNDPLTLYAVTSHGSLLASDDGGDSFTVRSRGFLEARSRLTLDRSDPWTLYADGPQGVLHSTDGGVTWATLWQGGFGRLAIDEETSKHLWVASCWSNRGADIACRNMRLQESQDGGEHWEDVLLCDLLESLSEAKRAKWSQEMGQRPVPVPIHQLQWQGELLVSTWIGLYRPDPSAANRCTRLGNGDETFGVVEQQLTDAKRRVVLTRQGIRALVRGDLRPWQVPGEGEITALAATQYGFFAQRQDGSVLNEQGDGWRWLHRPLALNTGLHLGVDIPPSQRAVVSANARPAGDPLAGAHLDNHVGAVLLHPTTPRRVYAGSLKGLFVSDDGARTWRDRSDGLMPSDVHALAYDERQELLFAGTHGGGVYVSPDDGRSWQRRSRGLRGGAVNSLWLDPRRPGTIVATVSGDLYLSRDSGHRWQRLNGRPGMPEPGFLRHGIVLQSAAGISAVLGLPHRGGVRGYWNEEASGRREAASDLPERECRDQSPKGLSSSLQGRQLLLDASRGILHLASDRGLWSTAWGKQVGADASALHRRLECAPWKATPGALNVQSLAIREHDGALYGGTAAGLWYLPPTVDAPDSDGQLPAWQALPLPDPESPIYSVAVEEAVSGVVIAGGDRGSVYSSFDGGATWRQSVLPKPLPDHQLRAALQPELEPLPLPQPPGQRQLGIARMRNHLDLLPRSAHRQQLRWQTELWGRWLTSEPSRDVEAAAALVRLDAASQLRRGGLKELTLVDEGRWLLANYVFDDGSRSHQELRLFDLHSVPWRGAAAHLQVGAAADWQSSHALSREPPHLLPAWQWDDAGDVLTTTVAGRAVVTRRVDGEIVLWSLRGSDGSSAKLTDDGAVRRPRRHRLQPTQLEGSGRPQARFSDDGEWLAIYDTGGGQPGLNLWRLQEIASNRLQVVPLKDPLAAAEIVPTALAWHPAEPRLIVAATSGVLFELALEGKQWGVMRSQKSSPVGDRLQALTWSPDGGWLAAVSSPSEDQEQDPRRDVMLWRWSALEGLGEAQRFAQRGGASTPQFDPSSRWLVSQIGRGQGGEEHMALWDLTVQPAREVQGFGAPSRFLSFLDPQRLLVRRQEVESWRLDAAARIAAQVEEHGSLLGGLQDVRAHSTELFLDAQGSTVVVAEGGAVVELWSLGQKNSAKRARIRLARYDRAHEDVDSAADVFLDLVAMLPGIDWQRAPHLEIGRRLCDLTDGPPSPTDWRRVLGKEPYRPFCGVISATGGH